MRATARTSAKAGLNDPPIRNGCGRGLTDKSYPGDNRVVAPESPYRRRGSLPRCRLTASWGWIRPQGLVCSPIKAVRELGSERRKTVKKPYNRAFQRAVFSCRCFEAKRKLSFCLNIKNAGIKIWLYARKPCK